MMASFDSPNASTASSSKFLSPSVDTLRRKGKRRVTLVNPASALLGINHRLMSEARDVQGAYGMIGRRGPLSLSAHLAHGPHPNLCRILIKQAKQTSRSNLPRSPFSTSPHHFDHPPVPFPGYNSPLHPRYRHRDTYARPHPPISSPRPSDRPRPLP